MQSGTPVAGTCQPVAMRPSTPFRTEVGMTTVKGGLSTRLRSLFPPVTIVTSILLPLSTYPPDAMEANLAELSKYQITNFFKKNTSATQQQCNLEAERITGMSVYTTPLQGGQSYTVMSSDGTWIVQFRAGYSALDMDLLGYIEQAYEGFAPHHQSIGKLGELHVYMMPNVRGVSMYLARDKLNQNDFALLKNTVEDFARFFASAWNKTPKQMPRQSRASLFTEYSSELSQLQAGLPVRFRPTLDYLISMLPSILATDWPLVPNHTDLLENNIHVSKQTGRLTGICDWKDTTISPFGMSLGGLEVMLGKHTKGWRWRYHPNQQELRDLFYEILYQDMGGVSDEQKKLLEAARLIGLFLANGWEWKDEVRVPASDESTDLKYLEAVTLTLWAQQTDK